MLYYNYLFYLIIINNNNIIHISLDIQLNSAQNRIN